MRVRSRCGKGGTVRLLLSPSDVPGAQSYFRWLAKTQPKTDLTVDRDKHFTLACIDVDIGHNHSLRGGHNAFPFHMRHVLAK